MSIPGALTSAALVIGVLATLVLGVCPAPLLDLANEAAEFVAMTDVILPGGTGTP